MDSKTGKKHKSNTKIAKSSSHNDSSHILFKTLTQRVEDMTELRTEPASAWLVDFYEVGGYSAPHHDYSVNQNIFGEIGNRLASLRIFVIYIQ